MNSPIIFDIETIPDRLTEYNQAFPKSKKKAGIHAIISRVVAIGYDLGGYWKDRGLIQRVGTVRKNGAARRGIWELTERARRILE